MEIESNGANVEEKAAEGEGESGGSHDHDPHVPNSYGPCAPGQPGRVCVLTIDIRMCLLLL